MTEAAGRLSRSPALVPAHHAWERWDQGSDIPSSAASAVAVTVTLSWFCGAVSGSFHPSGTRTRLPPWPVAARYAAARSAR